MAFTQPEKRNDQICYDADADADADANAQTI